MVAPYTISREFQAPRARVFEVNADPAHLQHWMGPAGFHVLHTALDFRSGGSYHYGLEGPNGAQMWGLQRYVEIVPGEKIVLVQAFSDEGRGLTRHPMSPTWPLEMLATTTFEDTTSGGTKVTVTWMPHESDEAGLATFDAARAGMAQGFAGMWDKLDAYLATLA